MEEGRGLVSRWMEGGRVRLYLHRLWVSYVKVLVWSLLRPVLRVLGHSAGTLLGSLKHY